MIQGEAFSRAVIERLLKEQAWNLTDGTLAVAEAIFQSLLHRAFTGQL